MSQGPAWVSTTRLSSTPVFLPLHQARSLRLHFIDKLNSVTETIILNHLTPSRPAEVVQPSGR